jgi:hypoxanthine phosphoribosyltransferase
VSSRQHGTFESLLSEPQIRARVAELGGSIGADFSGSDLVMVGVLKGCALFLADLIRATRLDLAVDFMAISSYSDAARQTGVVRIVKDLEIDIRERPVLLVEDIVDTGLTLTYLRRALAERGPRSLATVALLDRTVRRIVPVPIEYRGFEIDDTFVVGYGLDFQGRYRNLDSVIAVRDFPKLANDPLLLARGGLV